MASLTPGSLLHLLQSMSSTSSSPRPTVLQVIGIIPAPSAAASLSPSHSSFHLHLSDSLHSTHVSLPPSSPDSFSVGQLLLLDRLRPSHPLPLASNLRPLPRSLPISGTPSPLTVRTSPDGTFLIQPGPASPLAHIDMNVTPTTKHRGFSPSVKKSCYVPEQKEPYPALRVRSRPASPSKAEVPSLVAVKLGIGKAVREVGVVVPSRYRQPSPVGGRKGAVSPAVMRSSGASSPAMVRSSVAGEEGKKRLLVPGVAKVEVLQVCYSSKSESEEKGGMRIRDQQAFVRKQVALSPRLNSATSPRLNPITPRLRTAEIKQYNVKEVSTSEEQNTGDETEPFAISEKINSVPQNITVHDWKWTDGSVPLDAVSENLAKLGKEALQRRNLASIAAGEALEEALATESIIRSLSMFSDLCSSQKAALPLEAIDRFLSIYDALTKASAVAESLASYRTNIGSSGSISIERNKSISLWVEAALATDLEVVSLLNSATECPLKLKSSHKPILFSLDPPRQSTVKKHSVTTPIKSHPKVWCRGYEVGDTVELARALRREMQTWFLKFVEEAVDVRFRLFGEGSDDYVFTENNKLAAVLSHLRQVNAWLDGVRKKPEEESSIQEIERLKRKIYGFVISHVGSAYDSSVSLSNA